MLLKFRNTPILALNEDKTFIHHLNEYNCYGKTVLLIDKYTLYDDSNEQLYKVLFNGISYWLSEINFDIFDTENKNLDSHLNFLACPGETILDYMQEMMILKEELCKYLSLTLPELNLLLLGYKKLDNKLIKNLSETFYTSVEFWSKLEISYRKNLKDILDLHYSAQKIIK